MIHKISSTTLLLLSVVQWLTPMAVQGLSVEYVYMPYGFHLCGTVYSQSPNTIILGQLVLKMAHMCYWLFISVLAL